MITRSFLQLSYSSFFCRTHFDDSNPIWKYRFKFTWYPKLGSSTVHTFKLSLEISNRWKDQQKSLLASSLDCGDEDGRFLLVSLFSDNFKPHLSVHVRSSLVGGAYTPNHLFLDRSPNIGPLISRWELDKFRNRWNKSFRISKILILLYQQFSNLLISRPDMSGPRLGALSNNSRWLGG